MPRYRHEALLYAGDDGFADALVPFVQAAVATDEAAMVMLAPSKIELLRARLGAAADAVTFEDMSRIGRNPARIIPRWAAFVDEQRRLGRPARGIGEPIWAGRSSAELVECQVHERLLNIALDTAAPLWLVCPYDTAVLPPGVIEEALRSHPSLLDGETVLPSDTYDSAWREPFAGALPPPPGQVAEVRFGALPPTPVRVHVWRHGSYADVDSQRLAQLVHAVSATVAGSAFQGSGHGSVRVWEDAGVFVCELTGRGRLSDPLAGRRPPGGTVDDEDGLWRANQVCDLVQVRSGEDGTVVRMTVDTGDPAGCGPRGRLVA